MAVDTQTPARNEQSAEQTSSGAVDRLQQALEPARASLSRAYDAVQEKYGDAVGSAETYVQRSPGKTVAYAVAIGAVIGLVAGVILGQGKSELGSDESA